MGAFDVAALERAADMLLTMGVLKAGLVIGLLWIGIRLLPHWASDARAVLWALGAVALILLPLVGWMRPRVELQVFQFPQSLFAGDGASSVAPWLAVAWAAGAALLLARFGLKLLGASTLVRRTRPSADRRLGALLEEARRRVGVETPVRLRLAEEGTTPVLVGWRRPVVVLPRSTKEWPDERLLAVLCHELAHVRRRDYLWMVLTEVIRALYWINPVVFFGLREARVEQDKACDAAALRAGFRSPIYARHLVDVARSVRRASAPSAAVLGFLPRSRFRARVGALLDRPEGDGDRPDGRARVLALVGALVVISGTTALAATNLWVCTAAG